MAGYPPGLLKEEKEFAMSSKRFVYAFRAMAIVLP